MVHNDVWGKRFTAKTTYTDDDRNRDNNNGRDAPKLQLLV